MPSEGQNHCPFVPQGKRAGGAAGLFFPMGYARNGLESIVELGC